MPNIFNRQIKIPQTAFNKSYDTALDFLHGELVNIGHVEEVYPGDVIVKNGFGVDIQMPPFILPIRDPIDVYMWQFYCPWRLVMEKFPELLGVNNETAGYQTEEFHIPTADGPTNAEDCTIGDYMNNKSATTERVKVNALPGRVYYLIYNEYFRDQMHQDPYLINTSATDNEPLARQQSGGFHYYDKPLKVNKKLDMFTTAFTDPYGGPEIRVPLGGNVPVTTSETNNDNVNNGHGIRLVNATNGASMEGGLHSDPHGEIKVDASEKPGQGLSNGLVPANLIARLDLAQNAAPLDTLYLATALDSMNRIMQAYGHRYSEIAGGLFGAIVPETIYRPVMIGRAKIKLNVKTIYNQEGATGDESSKLGTPAAISHTLAYCNIGKFAVNEWGCIMTLIAAKHRRIYSQGIDHIYLQRDKEDLYAPPLANTGYEGYQTALIYATNENKNKGFGYGQRYNWLRYSSNFVTGHMRPGSTKPLHWTLAELYESAPILNADFLQEDRSALTDVLVTGTKGPDYYVFAHHNLKMYRPLPAYSTPGFPRHY